MDDERLGELLLRWEELRDEGHPATVEELCRDCPELADPLRRRVEVLKQMGAVLDVPSLPPTTPAMNTVSEASPTAHLWPNVPGYEILAELGRGGMGVVYRARQLKANRIVALKMILSGPQAAPTEVARFRREIETVASVQHPNLVAVYEVGEYEGRPFFSMECVEGGSLAELRRDRPLTQAQVAELVETLARAIHVVHRQGIVHRDLKPGNVLLASPSSHSGEGPGGRGVSPKITDFGLAKQTGSEGMTVSGSILGTPSYMAPEQARGQSREIGPHTDVWALGAILYELLVGRPPFLAESAWETIGQVTSLEPVPPRQVVPRVARDLETICLKCLQKEPARRYATALDLAEDLRRFRANEPIRARPAGLLERGVKWVRRKPAVAALAAVSVFALLVIVTGSAVYGIGLHQARIRSDEAAEQARKRLVRLHVAEGSRLLDEGDWYRAVVWFAEALVLDEGRPGEDAHRIRIGTTLRQSPRMARILFHDGPINTARFSADGRKLLTASDDGSARVWDALDGAAVCPPLRHAGSVSDAVFRPEADLVATASDDGTAQVWNALTGRSLHVFRHDKPLTDLEFDIRGRRLLTAGEDGTARVWDVETGRQVGVTMRHDGPVRCATFSPDGRLVLTGGDDHKARLWTTETGQPVLQPLTSDGPVVDAAFAPHGRLLVTVSADGSARSWDVTTGKSIQILKHRGAVTHVAFNNDGRLVATTSEDHTVSVWNPETGEIEAETLRHRSGVGLAVFSADGQLVASASDDNAARVWDAKYGEPLTPLFRHNGSVNSVAFSPDGRLLVTAGNDHAARIWDLASSPIVMPTHGPSFSSSRRRPDGWAGPGGRRAVVTDDLTVTVVNAETKSPLGPPLVHGSEVTDAAFSIDGRLLVTASDDNNARVWDWLKGDLLGPPLGHNSSVRFASFSPDGAWVVTGCADGTARVWMAATGEVLTPSLRSGSVVTSVAFDGPRLRLGGEGIEAITWDLSPEAESVAGLRSRAELWAGGRIDPGRGLLPYTPQELKTLWKAPR